VNPFFRGEYFLQVLVRDNNIDQALRVLKKKMQREGVSRDEAQEILRKAFRTIGAGTERIIAARAQARS
jgi:pentatricopeptide repeat protein